MVMNTARGRPTVMKVQVNRATRHRLRGTGGQVMAIAARRRRIGPAGTRGSSRTPMMQRGFGLTFICRIFVESE